MVPQGFGIEPVPYGGKETCCKEEIRREESCSEEAGKEKSRSEEKIRQENGRSTCTQGEEEMSGCMACATKQGVKLVEGAELAKLVRV
jgi:hypothetical protein